MEKKLEEKIVKKTRSKKEQVEITPNPASIEPEKIEPITKPNKISIKIHKNIIIAAVVIIIIAVIGGLLFYYKSLFVVATVNGSPISRLAVISELEKTAGKKTLESLITKKLIDDEARLKGIVITSADVDAELKTLEDQVKAQGATLEQILTEQGVTLEYLRNQITVQKELEGLLADKVQVSEDDISGFITENKVTIPEGQEDNFKEQIKNQIKQQKLSDAAGVLIESLRSKSKINYFINY